MTLEQFTEALDRHGGDLRRWPEPLRSAAADLAARDPTAGARLAEAIRLDGLLAASVAPVPIDAALVGAIVGRTRRRGEGMVLRPSGRLLTTASAAMVALFVVGFAIGATVTLPLGDEATALLLFDSADVPGEFL